MQDFLTRMYLEVRSAFAAPVARAKDERGQATAEYVGVILLLVAVIAALAVTGAGDAIANAIKGAVQAAINKVKDAVG